MASQDETKQEYEKTILLTGGAGFMCVSSQCVGCGGRVST